MWCRAIVRNSPGRFCPEQYREAWVLPFFAGRQISFILLAHGNGNPFRPWLVITCAALSVNLLTPGGSKPKPQTLRMPPASPQPGHKDWTFCSAFQFLFSCDPWKHPIPYCEFYSTFKMMLANMLLASRDICSWEEFRLFIHYISGNRPSLRMTTFLIFSLSFVFFKDWVKPSPTTPTAPQSKFSYLSASHIIGKSQKSVSGHLKPCEGAGNTPAGLAGAGRLTAWGKLRPEVFSFIRSLWSLKMQNMEITYVDLILPQSNSMLYRKKQNINPNTSYLNPRLYELKWI